MLIPPTMSSRRVCSLALLAAQLCCCAACSLGSLRPDEPSGVPVIMSQAAGATGAGGPFLYVAGWKLSMYALGSSKPLHTINTSYVAAPAIALDSHGDLCETDGNISDPAIFAFNARTLKPEHTLSGQEAFSLVADRSGYIYTTNGIDVYVYAPGCTQSVGTIRHGTSSGTLLFDQSGNLYVGEGRAVCIYAPTHKTWHMTLAREIRTGINGTDALAVGSSGELFVASRGRSSVTVFPPGGSEPIRRIKEGLNDPTALAVDSKGRLYVVNQPESSSAAGWVSVYAPSGTRPIRKLADETEFPFGLAVDRSDNVYVGNVNGNGGNVAVYTPGGAKLLRKITSGVDEGLALLIGSP
jgi:hypothetical protein